MYIVKITIFVYSKCNISYVINMWQRIALHIPYDISVFSFFLDEKEQDRCNLGHFGCYRKVYTENSVFLAVQ